MKEIVLELNGLNCASCAKKIEDFSKEIDGVEDANLDFISKKLKIRPNKEENINSITNEVIKIVKGLEPDVVVLNKTKTTDIHNGHEHTHTHDQVNKSQIIKLIIGGILFILPFLFKLEGSIRFTIYLLAYLIVGYKVILRAVKNISVGVPFDENFLMTIATIAAFGIGEYPEGVAVMLFYQVGEMFQGMAVNKSRNSISALLDIRPDSANLVKGGEIIVVDPEIINIGDYIIIKPGEKIPLDGEIVEGESFLDTSNITGESVPRKVKVGDTALSGVVNTEGLLKVRVNKVFGESTISKILDLVENASSKKAPTENFITKFAKYYTPAVVLLAALIATIPPLLMGEDWSNWIYRASVFLVISCPCALVISIPLGFFGGIGGASKSGILIKGGNFLEALNDIDTLVFDKTGTITKGTFEVNDVISYGDYSQDKILEFAAYGEYYSNHPIGSSIIKSYGMDINKEYISDYKEIPGKGISVKVNNDNILLGNAALLEEHNIKMTSLTSIGTVVYIAKENMHIGTITVADELKATVIEDIKKLKSLGIKQTIMLSGDNEEIAKKVSDMVGLDKVYGNLLPQDKVIIFEDIIKDRKSRVAFVGDGVNDAPVLARADVGIAMGGLGSDAAIEASDIVIMTDEIGKIATAIKIAKKTKKIVMQNIIFALGVKLIILTLGAVGVATMWEAVFADVGVSVIAILNSIRALRVEE